MNIQIKRPVIWVTIAYIAGILLSSLVKGAGWIAWTAALCLLVALWWIKSSKSYLTLGILLVFMWVGIINANIARIDRSNLGDFEGFNIELTGQILEIVKYDDEKAVYTLKTEYVEWEGRRYSPEGRIRLSAYFDEERESNKIFNLGDLITIKGELKKPQGVRNPKGFDYRAYLERQGVFYIMTVSNHQIELLGNKPFKWPHSWIVGTYNWMQNILEENLKDPALALVKSMIIGDRGSVPYKISDEFSATGLAHILSISGLHVGFIVVMLSFLQKFLKFPPKVAFIVQTALLCFYCLVAGAAASAVRATIMAIIPMGGKLLGRKPDPINSLALAALMILIFHPLDIFDVGFQLSFAAVGGIFLYSNIINRTFKFLPHSISSSISITLAAQLGTWPIIAYYFNIFSPLSLIANLLMVPISGGVVILGFIMIIISAVLPWLGSFIGNIVEFVCIVLIKGNSLIASIPWSSIKVISPSVFFLIVYYWIFWIMSDERPIFIKKPWQWSSGAVALLLLLTITKSLLPTPMEIIFLDVGQGDCIYIKTPERKHILIDGGGRTEGVGNFDVGEDIVVPFLLKNGVWHLDLVIMSHAHDDHIGGLISVVRDLKVGAFMEFHPKDISENYQLLKKLVDEKGITCISASGGQRYRIGEKVLLDVLYPPDQSDLVQRIGGDNENNRSLVIRLQYRDTSILLTGDIEQEVEDYLLDIYDFKVDILKVAHHGSRTSSTEEWIKLLQPKVAVIQVGNNMFGHPHPEVEQTLMKQGAKVYRNDRDGAVICSFTNKEWQVYTMVQE